MTAPDKPHSDEQLRTASDYLEYHFRMYVETLLWILPIATQPQDWNTYRNAAIEDHLLHARVIIEFLSRTKRSKKDDVIAMDYFHDLAGRFESLQDDFLYEQAQRIGGDSVHITTKPMPKLKSEQEWFIEEMALKIIPALEIFLRVVPDDRLAADVRKRCIDHLKKLSPPDAEPTPVSPSI